MNCVDQEILGSQVENVGGTICCQTEDQGIVTAMVGLTRLYFHYFLPVMWLLFYQIKKKIKVGPCCSDLGLCGNSAAHCNCANCVDYRFSGKYHLEVFGKKCPFRAVVTSFALVTNCKTQSHSVYWQSVALYSLVCLFVCLLAPSRALVVIMV